MVALEHLFFVRMWGEDRNTNGFWNHLDNSYPDTREWTQAATFTVCLTTSRRGPVMEHS